MKRIKRTLTVLATLALLLSLSGVVVTGVAAKGPVSDVSPAPHTPDYNNGVELPFDQADKKNANPPLGPGKLGETKTWLALDDYRGVINLKNYTLRGIGNHVEVWVGTNLNFPNTSMLNPLTTEDTTDFFTYDDCRNDGVRNVITDDQVDYLIDEFDTNMYPIESDWWGVPPARNGNKNLLAKQLGFPKSYYRGEGDNVVVLVDNVRDDNFYDEDNANSKSYIAGFYYSVFDDYFDRTVMSIDAWDWLHRTTADPPHAPTPDPCTSAPARPSLYEATFAHEYQHLLHHYTDPGEESWINEGLSDFTEVITGYADLSKHVDEKGYESHTNCYLGWVSVLHPDWNPIPRPCGPENSLPIWEDQGGDEILADYGFAMYFMNYLYSQGLDKDFFTAWQHNQATGIASLNDTLDAIGSTKTFESLFSDQIISSLIDGYLDNGATGAGSQYQNAAAEATIYFSGNANDTVGAPPWGADYIDLGDGATLTDIEFDGDNVFNYPGGNDWSVDDDDYFTNPDVGGDAAGNYGDLQDLSIARSIAGHDGQVLSFDHYYDLEEFWDFGSVQISTDNGGSWQSLACTGTTSTHDAAAKASIVDDLPGYTGTAGSAGTPIHSTCPALPAGTDLLAFRLQSDWATNADGWHIKNVQLNGANVGTPADLTGWDNLNFFSPLNLDFGFAVVGINGTVDAYGDVTAGSSVEVIIADLDGDESWTADLDDLDDLNGYGRVVAVIWGIPAAEDSTLYQPYSLVVNGDERADGND